MVKDGYLCYKIWRKAIGLDFLSFFLYIEGKRYKLIKHTVFCNGTCKIFDKDKIMIVF